jgi:hypothetical protein
MGKFADRVHRVISFILDVWALWGLLALLAGAGLVASLFGAIGALGKLPRLWLIALTGSAFLLVLSAGAGGVAKWRLRRFPHLNLVASSGPSSSIRLTVENQGHTTDFSARCALLGLTNSPNPPSKAVYPLKWEGKADQWITIHRGNSENLSIAQFGAEYEFGVDDYDRETWAFGTKKELLPLYEIEVRIVGKDLVKPLARRYLVRPSGDRGPLEMLPADELRQSDKNAI